MRGRSVVRTRRRRPSRTLAATVALAGVLTVLLAGWFVTGRADLRTRQRELTSAPGRELAATGAALAEAMRTELERVALREAARPYFHYQNLFHDPRAGGNQAVAPSPLAGNPEDALVLGYFQIDAEGRSTTPTVNDDEPSLSEPTRLAAHRQFREEVARSLASPLGEGRRVLVASADADGDAGAGGDADGEATRVLSRPRTPRVASPRTPANAPPPVIAQVDPVPTRGNAAVQTFEIDPSTYAQNNAPTQVYRQQNAVRPPAQQAPADVPDAGVTSSRLDPRLRGGDGAMDAESGRRTSSGDQDAGSGRRTSDGDQDAGSGHRTSDGDQDAGSGHRTSDGDQDVGSGHRTSEGDQNVGSGRRASDRDQDVGSGRRTSEGDQDVGSGHRTSGGTGDAGSGHRTSKRDNHPPAPVAQRLVDEPAAPVAREPAAPLAITVSALEWKTLPFGGAPALVAVRHVDTPDGILTQGFVVDRSALSTWLATHAGDVVAKVVASDRPGIGIVPGWQLQVSANPRAVVTATAAAAQLERRFDRKLAANALLALVAAAFVIWLVAHAERLAHERSQFAAAAAHELRTPLAGLQLYGDMLAGELGDPSKQRDYARRMSEEASRLGRVVSNVLGFSQLERGNLGVDPRTGSLADALRELAASATPALERAGAILVVDVPDALDATFDRDALARIVGNLLDNAEKYSRGASDRTIELKARVLPTAVEVAVHDHGAGIAPAARGRLFRPFARAMSPDAPPGLGLGLALSRSLARAMAGSLELAPAGPTGSSAGTTFVLRLPRAPA